MRNMKIPVPIVAAFALLLARQVVAADVCPPAGDADTHPVFDASLLKEGRFTYHTTLRGESLGDTVIEVRRDGPNYRITMNAPKIAQSWNASVRRDFAPLSAQLKMRAHGAPYEMSLVYDGTKVTGVEKRVEGAKPVNATVTGVVLDQRVDWASMMAVKAPPGSSFAVGVFDPTTGSSPMLGKLGPTQPLEGAWGKASAVRLDYSLCKREHVENYTVFATEATPRTMLREDMPNGLVSELIRVEP